MQTTLRLQCGPWQRISRVKANRARKRCDPLWRPVKCRLSYQSIPLRWHSTSINHFDDRNVPHGGHHDGRQRLSAFWTPTGGIDPGDDVLNESHSLLIRAGFVRQAYAGLFQLLPLGLRVHEKVEKLLSKHMNSIGASKIALSSISSQSLWKQSGRINDATGRSPEIFQFSDRKATDYLLSPTHEEEVTRLVGSIVQSYKDLPLKLYQITRKYRDEARPRHGLLRTREFLMKDLYTFDLTPEDALSSYEMVRQAYCAFFDELKLQYHVAKASSGEMGGDLSHEYHVSSQKGEDNLIICDACNYLVNEEVAESCYEANHSIKAQTEESSAQSLLDFASDPKSQHKLFRQWLSVTKDGTALIQVIIPTQAAFETSGLRFPEEPRVDTYKVQKLFPDLELDLSLEVCPEDLHQIFDKFPKMSRLYRAFDGSLHSQPEALPDSKGSGENDTRISYDVPQHLSIHGRRLEVLAVECSGRSRSRLTRIVDGDKCVKCDKGRLRVQSAIELGHTFHLGTRYSTPLKATVLTEQSHQKSDQPIAAPRPVENARVAIQMGCHGIGVSRLVATVADLFVDTKGLNWPKAIAPFEAIVIPSAKVLPEDQRQVYDVLTAPVEMSRPPTDVILDDRSKDLGWKLKDADMIGYPVLVILGRRWLKGEKVCEVQCRRLEVKKEVPLEDLKAFVSKLLEAI